MRSSENFFTDNDDILFHLGQRVDWKQIFELSSEEGRNAMGIESWEEYRDTWLQMLQSLGEIAGDTVARNAEKVDREDLTLQPNGDIEFGPSLLENLKTMKEAGIAALGINTEYGGLGSPFVAEVAAAELVSRACPSTYLNIVWFSPVAHIIEQFGDEEIKAEVIPRIAAGEWSGSMALTEADAGSDLAALRTYGEKQPDGSWRIYGSKRFISNGSGEVSLVLAKNAKGAEGLKNLNLFLVRRKLDDGSPNFLVTKLEDKVGLHGSATCELQFDGSQAVLLGKDGEGFMYMVRLMNDARIAVGLQGLGQMEASWRLARDFANERHSWNKPIAKHELIAEMLFDLEVEVKAFRSLCYQAAFKHSVAYFGERRLKDSSLSDEERKQLERQVASARKLVRKWTPLIKWWVGEKAVEHARKGLQIHGGYGFIKEYQAEWLVRESLILSIYEGTSQIQGLMCIKDTMKEIIRNPRDFVEVALGNRVQALRPGRPMRKKLARGRQLVNSALVKILFKLVKENVRSTLSEAQPKDLLNVVAMLSKDLVKFENLSPALLNAERICEMKAWVAMANCVVRDAEHSDDREWIAERFLNRMLIRLQALKSEIEMDDANLSSRIAGS